MMLPHEPAISELLADHCPTTLAHRETRVALDERKGGRYFDAQSQSAFSISSSEFSSTFLHKGAGLLLIDMTHQYAIDRVHADQIHVLELWGIVRDWKVGFPGSLRLPIAFLIRQRGS
jgi:hypothetical protein